MNKPLVYMARLCKIRIKKGLQRDENGNSPDNYHIFINSVDDIGAIIRTAGLTAENTKVVCSQSDTSKATNLRKLPEGFDIGTTLDPVKPINFYTSTAFEGQDIFDRDGQVFIVSNPCKAHTLVDISTSFIQICGRIRDAAPDRYISHIYDTTAYTGISPEDFETSARRKYEDARRTADEINSLSESTRKKAIRGIVTEEPYVTVRDGLLVPDRNMMNYEIVNYKVANGIYTAKSNVRDAMESAGLKVGNDDSYTQSKEFRLIEKKKVPFRDLFDIYAKIREETDGKMMFALRRDSRLELIEDMNPLVREAYEKLGRDEVVRMKYHQSNIKKKIIAISNGSRLPKILKMIDGRLPMLTRMPVGKVKEELQKIYDALGMEARAKSTDIDRWFVTRRETLKKDGRSVSYVTLMQRTAIIRDNTKEDED
ncbi:MAG: hypothetical protein OSJ55_06875 [Bacteroidales bacterium]|nr:hypothetical protein [Bacteroidales bacterium]